MLSDYIAHTFIHGSYIFKIATQHQQLNIGLKWQGITNWKIVVVFFVFPSEMGIYFKLTMYLTNIIQSNAICILLYNNIPPGFQNIARRIMY